MILSANPVKEARDDRFGEARPCEGDCADDESQDQPTGLRCVSQSKVDEPGVDRCLEQHTVRAGDSVLLPKEQAPQEKISHHDPDAEIARLEQIDQQTNRNGHIDF